MPTWQVPPDKQDELRTEFKHKAKLYGHDAIAKASHVDINAVDRLIKGENIIIEENVKRIFSALLNYLNVDSNLPGSIESFLNGAQRQAVAEKMDYYCIFTPRRHVNKPPKPVPPLPPVDADYPHITGAQHLYCMTVYAKLMHLRDRRVQKPLYKKFIARLSEEIDVFDELLIMRTLCFKSKPDPFLIVGRRPEYTDLQPIYPPRTSLNPHYMDRIIDSTGTRLTPSPGSLEHFEAEPEQQWQGAFSMYNAFQYKHEYVGSLMTENCDRLVMVIDLSDVPVKRDNLFLAGHRPTAYHIRRTSNTMEQRLSLLIEESNMGCFIVDSSKPYENISSEPGWNPNEHKLLKNDKYEIHFRIDWEAVRKAELEIKT